MNTNPKETTGGILTQFAIMQKRLSDQISLREHLKENASAHAISDFLYRSQETYQTSSVSFVADETSVDYQEVLHFFRLLDDKFFGSFIVGRKGNDSRINWTYDHNSIGAFILGKSTELKKVSPNAISYDGGSQSSDDITHTFHLRPNYKLDILLPADFDRQDLSRLYKWLDTIPFD